MSSTSKGMLLDIDPAALEELATLLLERAGLKIGKDGWYSLRLALSARLGDRGSKDARGYVRSLRGRKGEDELRALLPLVTVGKTEFFRDERQFHALSDEVLPRMLERARAEFRPLRIWSAGCATGEEVYSLAIVLKELGAAPGEVDVLGTDLNPAAVDRAIAGEFGLRQLGGLSAQRRARFFEPSAAGFRAKGELRHLVRFMAQNLAGPDEPVESFGTFDLILCRNVIIYFDLPTIRRVMDHFFDALRPNGLLFLGYSESLFKVYERFEMVEVAGAFVYGRSREKAPVRQEPPPERTAPKPRFAPPPHPARWVAQSDPPLPEMKGVPAAKPSPEERMAEVIQHCEGGRFQAAIRGLVAWVSEEPDQLEANLMLGNLHGLEGRLDEARTIFAKVISREPLCVEAHVYAGLAAFQGGKLAESRVELMRALFLEPTLALGHYLLAHVLEREGDAAGARKSYRNAISQIRFPQRQLAGYYPDLPEPEAVERAARYGLAALEEV